MKKIILMLLFITGVTAFAKAQDTTRVKKTPDQRAQAMTMMMQKKLSLTADQTKQVGVILTDRAEKMNDKTGKFAKMRALKESDTKIEAILTDDQKKVYAEMKENMKEKAKEMKANKAAAAPVTPAQ